MKKSTLPLKTMLGALVILSMIAYRMYSPSINKQTPMAPTVSQQNDIGQSAPNTGMPSQIASSTQNSTPINAPRTDAEVLQSIAQQNKNREKIAALLSANATITAQIRQQANAAKYETVNSQNIPAPDTTPVPAEILEKLKSNQLIHH